MAVEFNSGIIEQIRRTSNQNSSHMKVINIKVEHLKPFSEHPFELYKGQQLEDLIRSIRENGILAPILVRKTADGTDKNYEILSGHNRVNAVKEIGADEIPAIICVPKNDDEARILVIDSNFNQRSIKDMKPSELANSLHMLNEAIKKKPGYRSDLQGAEDGSQSDNKSRTMHVIGERYNLSQATIARYIRVAKLSKGLLECLDNRLIGLGTAEHLSYLRPDVQAIIQRLVEGNVKVGTRQAQELKGRSSDHELDEEEIRQIITPKAPPPKRKAIKLKESLFAKYFPDNHSPEEIEATIEKALELLSSQIS